MRGGTLEVKDIYGKSLELKEEDFGAYDRIQPHFTQFETVNMMEVYRRTGEAIDQLGDEGFVNGGTNEDITRVYDRARMYRNLNFALGRVPQDDYRVVFMREDELAQLLDDLWGQDHGRSGVRNRWMGILGSELQEQRSAYRDVHEYEGEPLPDYLPFVLREEEWDQIEEDVLEHVLWWMPAED